MTILFLEVLAAIAVSLSILMASLLCHHPQMSFDLERTECL